MAPSKAHLAAKATPHRPETPPRRSSSDPDREPAAKDPQRAPFDPLDPATRQAAQFGPPCPAPLQPVAPAEEIAPRARVSMEELLPQLVKRIAWAGDRRRGSVQLELGAGRHAGTTVTVHADDGRVRVELQGHDVEELRARIDARLKRQGLDVVSVE